VYSGYLNTTTPSRQLHYIMMGSSGSPRSDPLVLWLNGGPGCSSLLGAFSEIGPFSTNNSYKVGDSLIPNKHAWNKNANLLFLESPAGVGFSVDSNDSYTDFITAEDNYAALQSFFSKFPEFRGRSFFIAGESYAGKYIPDLARLVLSHGEFPLAGIMVGNGVFTFQDDSLTKSQIEYLISHNYIELEFKEMYELSCRIDWGSPRCRFFRSWFHQLRNNFNVYNIFEVCEPAEVRQMRKMTEDFPEEQQGRSLGMERCFSDAGMIDYLNAHRTDYNIKSNARSWSPCNDNIKYERDMAGSIVSYLEILDRVRILIYSGDFDDQVPLTDTKKNLEGPLRLQPVGEYNPWFHDDQHAGFVQLYHENLTLVTVKGAGHMVPQDRRGPSEQMFVNFMRDRPMNTPLAAD
jgi:serine carboxypeptidase-like clade 2